MAKANILQKLGVMFGPKKGLVPLPMRVRRKLVAELYSQPASLAIGAINGVVATAIGAWASGVPALFYASILITIIASARVFAALQMADNRANRSIFQMELFYEVGAFAYSLSIGTIAALALWYQAGAGVEVLLVANALGYGVGGCARNAGRPQIALGQLALVCLPVMAVALVIGSVPLIALFFSVLLLIPAMASITMNVFKILQESVAAADKSAKLADEMQILARSDVVTGLANRAGLNHAMEQALCSVDETSRLALIWIDLDKFKEVNDLFGHPVGDLVLCKVASRLSETCPTGATVARFGGDEFIVFTPIADRKDTERIASEIHAEIMRPIRIDGKNLEVRASVGVATLPEDGMDADKLMKSADLALYHAKEGGRAQTQFFTPSMTSDLVRRRDIEADLRKAIMQDELCLAYQPIIDLETGKIRSFEALVRWQHPEKGLLAPDEFIPVAEETGLILRLGNWITAQAAKTAATWPDDVGLAVNFSALQIRSPGAALGVINALRAAQLDPSRLELEVTESLFVDDNQATSAFIDDLSERGVKFALDDFGTGYSSLGYINRYPFSKIKIDRSFVSGENVSRKSNAIIRAVAEKGEQLGMEIVAEGLEEADQVRWIKETGCTLGQGYYFSRPVTADEAANLLARECENGLTAQPAKKAR
ncbi:MAG: EAL domain-containing protein [Erythrobacter sp.]